MQFHEQFRDRNMHVDIEVKRAPTDESIKLFKEMQEKAIGSIVESGIFPNNLLEAKWVVFHDIFHDQYKVIIFFKLNNKEHKIDIVINSCIERQDRIEQCYKELANYMAGQMLLGLSNTPSKNLHDSGGNNGYKTLIGQRVM